MAQVYSGWGAARVAPLAAQEARPLLPHRPAPVPVLVSRPSWAGTAEHLTRRAAYTFGITLGVGSSSAYVVARLYHATAPLMIGLPASAVVALGLTSWRLAQAAAAGVPDTAPDLEAAYGSPNGPHVYGAPGATNLWLPARAELIWLDADAPALREHVATPVRSATLRPQNTSPYTLGRPRRGALRGGEPAPFVGTARRAPVRRPAEAKARRDAPKPQFVFPSPKVAETLCPAENIGDATPAVSSSLPVQGLWPRPSTTGGRQVACAAAWLTQSDEAARPSGSPQALRDAAPFVARSDEQTSRLIWRAALDAQIQASGLGFIMPSVCTSSQGHLEHATAPSSSSSDFDSLCGASPIDSPGCPSPASA